MLSRVPPVLNCLSSGIFGWIGSENCLITAPAATLLVWISVRNGENTKTLHVFAQMPPCGQCWYHKCWRHLTKTKKDNKYKLILIFQIFLRLIDSFPCIFLTTIALAKHSKDNSRKPILFFQRLFLICCFCGWNRIFMNNKSLFFLQWNRNSEFRNHPKAKAGD